MKKNYLFTGLFLIVLLFSSSRSYSQACIASTFSGANGLYANPTPGTMTSFSGVTPDAQTVHDKYFNAYLYAGRQYRFDLYLYFNGFHITTTNWATITDSANNVLQTITQGPQIYYSSTVTQTVRIHISNSSNCTPVATGSTMPFYIDLYTLAMCPHAYRDVDGDGYGNPADSIVYGACPNAPVGYVTDNTDCNDNDSLAHMVEDWYPDVDGDGYGDLNASPISSCGEPSGAAPNYVINHTDCNDADILAYSSATWYTDNDHDGFGSSSDAGTIYCGNPNARLNLNDYSLNNRDCDDNNPMIGPYTPEDYNNSTDENCDGVTVLKNNALDFDGNDFVYVPDNGTLDLNETMTIEARVFVSGPGFKTIVDKGAYRYLFLLDSTRLGFYTGVIGAWRYSTSYVPANEWAHVAVSIGLDDTLRFFINGVAAGAYGGAGLIQDNGPFAIGRQGPDGTCNCNHFVGKMDEVRIWNVARSQTELVEWKDKGLCPQETGLMAYYKFNDGVAGGDNTGIFTVKDYSGNGNTGSLNMFSLNSGVSNFVAGDSIPDTYAVIDATASTDTVCTGSSLILSGTGADNYVWTDNVENGVGFTSLSTHTYYMLGYNNNGCSAIDSVTVVVQNCQVAQSINFPAIATMHMGDPDFALNATASSGLAVSYNSSDLSVATISGNMVTITGVGTCTITATQAGDPSFFPAADETQLLTVLPAVGLNNITATKGVIMYPNPAHDVLNIKLMQPLKNAQVTITNVLGQKVYSQPYTGAAVSLQGLDAGMYHVSINGDGLKYDGNIIVE